MSLNPEKKRCGNCRKLKDISKFYRNKSRGDGLQTWCKVCITSYQKKKEYPSSLKERKKIYSREWRKKNIKRTKQHDIQKRLKNKNLTEQEYHALVVKQGGKCAICQKEFVDTPAIDHNHNCCPGIKSCGKCVRGLLCRSCNYGIGILGENIFVLESAISYLKRNQ